MPIVQAWSIGKHALERDECARLDRLALEKVRREVKRANARWQAWCSEVASKWLLLNKCGDVNCLSQSSSRFCVSLLSHTCSASLYSVQDPLLQELMLAEERTVDVVSRELHKMARQSRLSPVPAVMKGEVTASVIQTRRRVKHS